MFLTDEFYGFAKTSYKTLPLITHIIQALLLTRLSLQVSARFSYIKA